MVSMLIFLMNIMLVFCIVLIAPSEYFYFTEICNVIHAGSLDGWEVTRNHSAEHKNGDFCVELIEDTLDLKGLLIILNNQVRDVYLLWCLT